MMNRRYLGVLGAACTFLALVPSASVSQIHGQAAEIAAGFGKVEFENESIVVFRVHMAAHEKTPMHDIVSPRLVIWLTDAHLRDIAPDGRAEEYRRARGSIDWVTPRRHMGENLGDRSIDFLAVIPKVVAGEEPRHTSPH